MILTYKAKADFIKWCKQDAAWMDTYYDLFLFALIIEWLDSVGFITEIDPLYYDGWMFESVVYDRSGNNHYVSELFNTRQEATKAAIEKANELYNETNKTTTR